jgi:glycosyltransferase involved in cell wall biosynthesis
VGDLTVATIALVMIVKNEETVLARCVESVRSIIDEFVIVDTGSTDGTKDIIGRYGPLHEIPFTNFVDTKNAALDLVTSDYVLFMDADETIISGLEFLKEHAETGTECVLARIVENSESNVYFRARLWRNNPAYRFVGPGVHEVLTGYNSQIIDHRIRVEHNHAHRTGDSYVERFNKYITILNNHLQGHPEDPRALFYLGRTHKDMGNSLEAIANYRRYLELNTSFIDERWQSAYDIALCWKAEGEYDQCLEACNFAESIDPRRAEVPLLRGQVYFDLQDIDTAIDWFEQATALPVPDNVLLFMNPRAYRELPLDYLVLCHAKKHDFRRSREITQQLAGWLIHPDQRIVNNLTWLRKQESRTIFFMLGQTPEPVYGGMIEDVGVGGVETTYLELPDELAKLGHTVFVFCRCEKEHTYHSVYFVPYTKVADYADWKPDCVITSRWYDSLYMFPEAKKIIWTQDAHFADPNHPDAFKMVDAVVCSSRWHRQYIAQRIGEGLDAKKLHIIPLAIRKELFQRSVNRDPLKVIYSSNPSRGLYVLVDMWGDISAAVPGIHLTVTYGWEGLKTWSSDPAWLEKITMDQERIEGWANEAGNVTLAGRLTKARLAEEMMSSTLCLYPNNFWETMCLSGLENQAAGTPMITSRLGALPTTLSSDGNIIIEHSPSSPEYRREFINATVDLLQNTDRWNRLSEACLRRTIEHPGWDIVAQQWETVLWE